MRYLKYLSLILLLIASPALAVDRYYDATGGSDGGAGTEGDPFQTNDKFYTDILAAACGDRFFFKRGETWTANDSTDRIFVLDKDCTSGTKIVLDAYGTGDRPIIDGGAINIDVARIETSSWVEIKNLWVRGGGQKALAIVGSSDILADSMETSNSGWECVQVLRKTSISRVSTRVTIQNSLIHDCANEAVYVGIDSSSNGGVEDTSNHVVISNNEIYNASEVEFKPGVQDSIIEGNYIHDMDHLPSTSTSGAILVQRSDTIPGSTNAIVRNNLVIGTVGTDRNPIRIRGEAEVYGNVISGSTDGQACIEVQDPAGDGAARRIYNNTLYNCAGASVFNNSGGTGFVARNNLAIANGSGNDAGTAGDHFVNAAGGDFHLIASSAAIDAGTNCDLPFVGASCDLGAFEFGEGQGGTGLSGATGLSGSVVLQ